MSCPLWHWVFFLVRFYWLLSVSLAGPLLVQVSALCCFFQSLATNLYLKASGMWANSRKGYIRSKVVNYINIFF